MLYSDENKFGNKSEKLCCLLIFGVMLVYLLMQFSKVMVYFDDFGYL